MISHFATSNYIFVYNCIRDNRLFLIFSDRALPVSLDFSRFLCFSMFSRIH